MVKFVFPHCVYKYVFTLSEEIRTENLRQRASVILYQICIKSVNIHYKTINKVLNNCILSTIDNGTYRRDGDVG